MPLTGVNIDLPLQAHVPTDYVTNEGLRLQLYRRMGNITSAAEIDALAQELADRFGPLPKAVENLMFQLHLKVLAAKAQVSAIVRDRERNNIVLKCEALEHFDRLALQKKLGSTAGVQRRERRKGCQGAFPAARGVAAVRLSTWRNTLKFTLNSRNYGAWSLRGWLLCRMAGLDFVEDAHRAERGARERGNDVTVRLHYRSTLIAASELRARDLLPSAFALISKSSSRSRAAASKSRFAAASFISFSSCAINFVGSLL